MKINHSQQVTCFSNEQEWLKVNRDFSKTIITSPSLIPADIIVVYCRKDDETPLF